MSKKLDTNSSSYDKEIMMPLKIMKGLLIFYILFNMFLPTYSSGQLGCSKLYCYISILVMSLGVYAAHGHLGQIVPLLPLCVIKFIQFILEFIYFKRLNIISFILLLFIDFMFCVYLMIDRGSFEYISESEDD